MHGGHIMSSGISGVNSQMAELMQILLKGVNESTDLAMASVAVGVENKACADKMAIAQSIIDAYA